MSIERAGTRTQRNQALYSFQKGSGTTLLKRVYHIYLSFNKYFMFQFYYKATFPCCTFTKSCTQASVCDIESGKANVYELS